MSALDKALANRAFFISPVVDMENLTSMETASAFAGTHNASFPVIPGGEHRLYTAGFRTIGGKE